MMQLIICIQRPPCIMDGHKYRGVVCQGGGGSGRLGIVRLVAVAGIPGGDGVDLEGAGRREFRLSFN